MSDRILLDPTTYNAKVQYYCNVKSWTGSCTTTSLGKLTSFPSCHGKYLMYIDTVQIPATKWQQNKFNNANIQGSEITLTASTVAATRTVENWHSDVR